MQFPKLQHLAESGGANFEEVDEATQAVTATAKTYKLKKYAGAGFGMWRDDAAADGFKVKLVRSSEDTDDQVWDAFDGSRKVGSFSDAERRGWLQAKLT